VETNSDIDILQLIAEEKTFDKGLRILILKYQEPLYWHIRRMVHIHQDADDVIQNTFIKVYKHIRKFKQDSKLYTWLYRIATNESITFIQKKRKHLKISGELNEITLMQQLKADDYFDGNEAQVKLIAAIAKLPMRQKQVFNMRYYDDLSYNEIAEILEVSVGSLKASYHHAAKKIENHLIENVDHVG